MRSHRRSLLRDERGQIALVAPIMILMVFVLFGIAFDAGLWYFDHRRAVTQAEAAALAGAQELSNGTTAVEAAVVEWLSKNGVEDCVAVDSCPDLQACPGTNPLITSDSVQVCVRRSVSSTFAALAGVNSLHVSSGPIKAKADITTTFTGDLLPLNPEDESVITPGDAQCDAGEDESINFTGSVGSAGDAWIALFDPAPTGVPDIFSSPINLSTDVLICTFNNSKGGGLVALYNQISGATACDGSSCKGLALLLLDAGNSDRLSLNMVNYPGGQLTGAPPPASAVSLQSVSMGSLILCAACGPLPHGPHWYRLLMEVVVGGPTRLYLPSSGTAAVSPAFNSDWEITSTTIAPRRPTSRTRTGTALLDQTPYNTDANDLERDYLSAQFVSAPLTAQTIEAQAVKFQMKGRELAAANGGNMLTTIGIRLVANDGSEVVGGTMLAVTRDDLEMDGTNPLENRQFTATTSQVTAQAGDRIVIEIGAGGDPDAGSNHRYTLNFGDRTDVSDLSEDNTDTQANNPWVEFANPITFQGQTANLQVTGRVFQHQDEADPNSPLLGTPLGETLLHHGPLPAGVLATGEIGALAYAVSTGANTSQSNFGTGSTSTTTGEIYLVR